MFINLSEVSPLSHTHTYIYMFVCELYIKRIIFKKRLPNINGHIKCMWYQTDYFVTLVRTTFLTTTAASKPVNTPNLLVWFETKPNLLYVCMLFAFQCLAQSY